MNNDNSRLNYDDEIDLRQLYKSLKERSRFIFGFTGVVTLLAIGYVLSLNASNGLGSIIIYSVSIYNYLKF